MFGLYRTFLAILVAFSHLVPVPVIGQHAVAGFFVLSGYLMTHIMQESYGYTGGGRGRFVVNRALRLYPSYLATLLLTVGVIAVVGSDATAAFHPYLSLPPSLSLWLQNLSLVFLDWMPNTVQPRLSPATWALTTELFYYALICAGISRSMRATLVWLVVSIAYHLFANMQDGDKSLTYFHILAGSLPFALGALIYHTKAAVPRALGSVGSLGWAAVGAIFVIVSGFFALNNEGAAGSGAFYLNILASAGIVVALKDAAGNRRRDWWSGSFSYHIYILHWIVGFIVISYALEPLGLAPQRGVPAFVITVAACCVISLGLTLWVDKPVEHLRKLVRDRASKSEPELPAASPIA